MLRNDQLAEWDRAHFFHPSTHLGQFARGEMNDRIITSGKGVYITDRDGVDAFSMPSRDSTASTSAMAGRKSPMPSPRRQRSWPITTPMSATAPKPRSRSPR